MPRFTGMNRGQDAFLLKRALWGPPLCAFAVTSCAAGVFQPHLPLLRERKQDRGPPFAAFKPMEMRH